MRIDYRELLYKSFDMELSPEEKQKLQEGLEQDPQLKAEYRQIARLRETLSAQKGTTGFPDVTAAVMDSIREPRSGFVNDKYSFDHYLQSAFRPLLAAALLLIVLLSGFNIIKSGEVSLKAVLSLQEATITDALDPTLTLLEE